MWSFFTFKQDKTSKKADINIASILKTLRDGSRITSCIKRKVIAKITDQIKKYFSNKNSRADDITKRKIVALEKLISLIQDAEPCMTLFGVIEAWKKEQIDQIATSPFINQLAANDEICEWIIDALQSFVVEQLTELMFQLKLRNKIVKPENTALLTELENLTTPRKFLSYLKNASEEALQYLFYNNSDLVRAVNFQDINNRENLYALYNQLKDLVQEVKKTPWFRNAIKGPRSA